MGFDDLQTAALQLNALYAQIDTQRYGCVWTTGEIALGFVGDIGDLAKLAQAHAGIRSIDDCHAKLGHELSGCLCSILVLADKCGIDLEAAFVKHTRAIGDHVAGELAGNRYRASIRPGRRFGTVQPGRQANRTADANAAAS